MIEGVLDAHAQPEVGVRFVNGKNAAAGDGRIAPKQ